MKKLVVSLVTLIAFQLSANEAHVQRLLDLSGTSLECSFDKTIKFEVALDSDGDLNLNVTKIKGNGSFEEVFGTYVESQDLASLQGNKVVLKESRETDYMWLPDNFISVNQRLTLKFDGDTLTRVTFSEYKGLYYKRILSCSK